MARLVVCDAHGAITADIEAAGPVLRAALEHEKAEPLIRCAVLMALSALVEGGVWPAAVLRTMADVMNEMKREVLGDELM
jgi:hypothetical protein